MELDELEKPMEQDLFGIAVSTVRAPTRVYASLAGENIEVT